MEEIINGCSFTGHREIRISDAEALPALLLRGIEYVYQRGCKNFYCGGALGFDTLAAEAVIAFRRKHKDVKLYLVIPCANQDERWNSAQRKKYAALLKSADGKECLAESYYDGCMQARNARLVELCDVVIAYLYRQNSGAGQTVRIAKNQGKTVYNLVVGLS